MLFSLPLFSLHALQVSTVNCAAELEKQVRGLQQAWTAQTQSSAEAQADAHNVAEQLEQASRSFLAKDAELVSVKVTWHPALHFSLAYRCICCLDAVIYCDH